MSDEILELRRENNALKEMNGKLEVKIAELSKEIEAMKSERSYQQSSAEATIDNHASQLMKRTHEGEESSEITRNVKRPKLIKERCVPNWLFEVLAWINRIEMANSKLSTSSELFKQICWPKLHLNVKPHKIQRLEFFPVHYELGNLRAFVRRKNYNEQFGLFSNNIPISSIIPIASIPAPDYIIGFEEINIKFMDEPVLNFIKSISRLLQDFKLDFKIQNSSKMDKKQIASIHSLLEYLADNIFELMIHGPNLNYFNRIFPSILDQIEFIYLRDPGLENDQIDAILNWLTNPMNNRKQKILKSTCPKHEFTTELINRIKERDPDALLLYSAQIRWPSRQGVLLSTENAPMELPIGSKIKITWNYKENDKIAKAIYTTGIHCIGIIDKTEKLALVADVEYVMQSWSPSRNR